LRNKYRRRSLLLLLLGVLSHSLLLGLCIFNSSLLRNLRLRLRLRLRCCSLDRGSLGWGSLWCKVCSKMHTTVGTLEILPYLGRRGSSLKNIKSI
jgi:hypothetical protein